MRRRDGSPLWVSRAVPTQKLKRVDLGTKASPSAYDESWLQALLHTNPDVMPIGQIEPGFGDLIAVCRELPLKSGYLDNLFITREGRLVIVEAKLWRNPEARRVAVAQVMDYAAAIFAMSYSDLESAIVKARAARTEPLLSLFEIANGGIGDGDMQSFIDAVSWNLRQGRAVVAVVGDGIREDILPLSHLLQSHAGYRFTFSLVELAIYETPTESVRVVIPSVLAQTMLIERGVIRIDRTGSNIEVASPAVIPDSTIPSRPMSISEDEFLETLSQKDPTQPEALRAFLSKADGLGVYPEFLGSLNLKHASPKGPPLNMGSISKGAVVDTGPATWWQRTQLGDDYNRRLADMIGGFVKHSKNGEESGIRTRQGKMPKLSDLLPQHQEAWLEAIECYIRDNFTQSDNESSMRAVADQRVWGGSSEEFEILRPAEATDET